MLEGLTFRVVRRMKTICWNRPEGDRIERSTQEFERGTRDGIHKESRRRADRLRVTDMTEGLRERVQVWVSSEECDTESFGKRTLL